MIILRKPTGPPQFIILAETPSGVRDAVNQVYSTSYMYRPDRMVVYYNGQAYHSPDDFEEVGPSTFRLIHVYPDDSDELRVTYEVDECNGDPTTHDALDHYFLQLLDTPSNYNSAAGMYVRVKDDQSGLEFKSFSETVKDGVKDIPSGVSSVTVTFDTPFSSTNYRVVLTLENTVDAPPSIFPILINSKTTGDFTVLFSAATVSPNFKLNWSAKLV